MEKAVAWRDLGMVLSLEELFKEFEAPLTKTGPSGWQSGP